jgi:GNAT superfamily N-acetyltransferase
MVETRKINTRDKADVNAFITFPFRLYDGYPQWVQPLLIDMHQVLNREKHPFYEHSKGDFFIATRNGRVVGRIAALENTRYNDYHDTRQAQFYFFDCEDDQEVAKALFERVFEWARVRGLDQVVGPKGLSAFDGYGMLVEGFEHRQMMTMMNYNYPYYPRLIEALGFRKEVDFVSCYLHVGDFHVPERVHRIAERVRQRGSLRVYQFRNKRDLRAWSLRIGRAYNRAFVENWEYYPLTEREIKFLTDNLMMVANPRLLKIIIHGEDVVGFLFAFPDVSAALQRAKGRLFPLGIFDLLLEMRRTRWVSLNGAGILPQFQGRGGNALLYSEMERTIREFHFDHADLTQVAESAVQMRRDLINLGAKPYKNHRVYIRDL